MDMRDLLNILDESEELLEVNDSFDIELGEDLLIETGVLELAEDGVVVAADEDVLKLLEEHGIVLEDTDWSQYDEPTVSRIKKGMTKPVDRTDYNIPTHMRKAAGEQPKTGFDKRRASLIKQGILKADESLDEGLEMSDLGRAVAAMMNPRDKQRFRPDQIDRAVDVVVDQEGYDVDPRDRSKVANIANKVIQMLNATSGPTIHEGEIDESGLQAYLGNKKYGKEGMDALRKAGREGASKEQMAKLRAKYDKLDEFMYNGSGDDGDGDDDMKDRIIQMYKEDGLRETEIAKLEGISELEVHKIIDAHERGMDEAKYQGREVPLGKPMKGDVKKSKVYVKKPNGKVVKVNFGDKKMRIKKSNPKRRKSFRARHNCKNPGPRWKARYWSCRAW